MATAARRFDAAIAAGIVFAAASPEPAATARPRKITIYPGGPDDGVGTGKTACNGDTTCP